MRHQVPPGDFGSHRLRARIAHDASGSRGTTVNTASHEAWWAGAARSAGAEALPSAADEPGEAASTDAGSSQRVRFQHELACASRPTGNRPVAAYSGTTLVLAPEAPLRPSKLWTPVFGGDRANRTVDIAAFDQLR